ncbi:hypothetical protein ACFL3R_00600 [Thermodesulfobacteriota bacterium]
MEKENGYNLRSAVPTDYPYIEQCLLDEGFDRERHSFLSDITYMCDIGFFSWRMEHGYPRLTHFYLNKNNRGVRGAYALTRLFEAVMRNYSFEKFIAEVPAEKPELEKFIRFLGTTEPFTEQDGDKFYLVDVGGYDESL